MNKIFLLLLMLTIGCASPGTVGVDPAKGLLDPVTGRVDGYIAINPDGIDPARLAEYNAAKVVVASLPANERVKAAGSWLAVQAICNLHDELVSADANIKEPHKSTYLRSTTILRRIYAEAFAAEGAATQPSATSSPAVLEVPLPDKGDKR